MAIAKLEKSRESFKKRSVSACMSVCLLLIVKSAKLLAESLCNAFFAGNPG